MANTSAQGLPFQTIGIFGCGLIGCSIAAALKKRNFSGRVVGCNRAGSNLETAIQRGHIDRAETDRGAAARQCDLIVVCTPVDVVAETVRALAAECRAGTLITDCGSVKWNVEAAALAGPPSGVTFIGSHPIAGSEKQGCANANADLFENHVCVLTPERATPRREVERLADFWRALGLSVVEMSAAAHDRALARTSHVPHAVAAALALSLEEENRHLAAGGFLDSTRIAAGDPELWAAILLSNTDEVAAGIDAVSERLAAIRHALVSRDKPGLLALLRAARDSRDAAAARAAARHASPPGQEGN